MSLLRLVFAIFTIVLFSTNFGWAKSSQEHRHTKKNIPSNHILTKDGCTYKIVFDSKKKKISLFATGLKDPKPPKIVVTLKKKDKPYKKVTLRLTESHEGVDYFQNNELVHDQSSVQFGFSFDVDLFP